MTECKEFAGFLPFQQSEPYAAAAAANGARVRWCDLEGGETLVVERGRLRVILRGPPARVRALRHLARWPGLTIVTPETEVKGFGLVPLVTPMHHAIWDLGRDLRKGLSGKWRNRLTTAENAGIVVQSGDQSTLSRLLQEETLLRRARGYRSLPPEFTLGLPTPTLRLWTWQHGRDCAAAMAFVRHGTTATYHLGWGSDAARQAGVHPVMLMTAARALQAEGVRWLDLGSVDTDRAPGLARFKLGTGAVLKRLGATALVLP